MSDTFQITPPVIRAEGKDVPPEQIQSGFNNVCRQVQIALNTVSSDPTGPAGGDLSGTYPNPTVSAVHATSGTLSSVGITSSTIDSSVIGGVTPAVATFTSITLSTPLSISNGGTGASTASAARTALGLGTISTQNANNAAITGGTIDNTPIGQTTTAAGSFTTLNSTGGALNGSVGATTPSTGSFTTLAASSTVSGTGFSTYLASPPAIGGTAANAGSFTTLSASSTVSGTGFSAYLASPPAIGGTAANAGSFTTLSASSTITPSQTAGIVGTNTNNNANAGSVGEFISSTVLIGSAVSLTSGVTTNITSISLTAGDWDVWGNFATNPGGTTSQTIVTSAISTTSATFPTVPNGGSFVQLPYSVTGVAIISNVGQLRLSLSATTTVYLVINVSFSVSTNSAYGFLGARRRR